MESDLTFNATLSRFLQEVPLEMEIVSMTIDQKLARLGELTTIVTLISPFPAFISCGMSSIDKDRQL